MNEDGPSFEAATAARLVALEFVVQLLVATHPDRDLLRSLWNGLLPEQLDEWLKQPCYQEDGAFREMLHEKLAQMHGFLDVLPLSTDEAND